MSDEVSLLKTAINEVHKLLLLNQNIAFIEENSEELNELIHHVESKLEFWKEHKIIPNVVFNFCFFFLERNSKGPHYCLHKTLLLNDKFEKSFNSLIEVVNTKIKMHSDYEKFDYLIVSVGAYKGCSLVDYLYYDVFYAKSLISLI